MTHRRFYQHSPDRERLLNDVVTALRGLIQELNIDSISKDASEIITSLKSLYFELDDRIKKDRDGMTPAFPTFDPGIDEGA